MIELKNVSKIYKNKKYAINDISLAINDGEFVYIVGHSGAGKSTLLRLIYRQEKATIGSVVVNGRDISKIRYSKVPKYRREVGFVFQDYQLLPHKTTFENVAYALEVRGERRLQIREQVREVLELVGLKDKEKSYPAQLSGGEQQRVAIARAIVNKPSILIADEPTGNLDPITSKTVIDVLQTINKLGTTVVVATHDQLMVNNYPQRTITFKNGVIYHDALDSGYIVGDDAFDVDDDKIEGAEPSVLDAVKDEMLKEKATAAEEAPLFYDVNRQETTAEVQAEFLHLVAQQDEQRHNTVTKKQDVPPQTMQALNSEDEKTLFKSYNNGNQQQQNDKKVTEEKIITRASRRRKEQK